MKRILSRIKILREEKGVPQKKMADLLGYSTYTGYAKVENGLTELTVQHLIKICDALNTTPNELLGIGEIGVKRDERPRVTLFIELDEGDQTILLDKYLKPRKPTRQKGS